MGPLMDSTHPRCLKTRKTDRQWRIYIRGAAALFASYIAKGSKVIVLSQPPPQKLNPSGHTNYQVVEEPILKGFVGDSSVGRIDMVHPTVQGAEDCVYQSWPVDNTEEWVAKYRDSICAEPHWRCVKVYPEIKMIISITAVPLADPLIAVLAVGLEKGDRLTRCSSYSNGQEVVPSDISGATTDPGHQSSRTEKGDEALNKATGTSTGPRPALLVRACEKLMEVKTIKAVKAARVAKETRKAQAAKAIKAARAAKAASVAEAARAAKEARVAKEVQKAQAAKVAKAARVAEAARAAGAARAAKAARVAKAAREAEEVGAKRAAKAARLAEAAIAAKAAKAAKAARVAKAARAVEEAKAAKAAKAARIVQAAKEARVAKAAMAARAAGETRAVKAAGVATEA
ncbi:hypothetical protein KVT40_003709 [Elsinoe batatas]|uniref:Uncharacterized protein n=1 Tax=Elsinoe batatas TaxID=2601811 RepID=A0A8K0L0W1_9PEZI|nr:hypothetical protein KVT40_003709 [Elsinoe batatas]